MADGQLPLDFSLIGTSVRSEGSVGSDTKTERALSGNYKFEEYLDLPPRNLHSDRRDDFTSDWIREQPLPVPFTKYGKGKYTNHSMGEPDDSYSTITTNYTRMAAGIDVLETPISRTSNAHSPAWHVFPSPEEPKDRSHTHSTAYPDVGLLPQQNWSLPKASISLPSIYAIDQSLNGTDSLTQYARIQGKSIDQNLNQIPRNFDGYGSYSADGFSYDMYLDEQYLDAGQTRRASADADNSGAAARDHHLYQKATTGPDGLYHCPWEGKDPSCTHKPEKLKCNYDKFVDSHLKPYCCKVHTCENFRFSSTACLRRHEREAHNMHGHGEKPFLCTFSSCERGLPGHGFPHHWNLRDHMRRVHKTEPSTSFSNKSAKLPRKRKSDTAFDSVNKRSLPSHPPQVARLSSKEQLQFRTKQIEEQLSQLDDCDPNDPTTKEKLRNAENTIKEMHNIVHAIPKVSKPASPSLESQLDTGAQVQDLYSSRDYRPPSPSFSAKTVDSGTLRLFNTDLHDVDPIEKLQNVENPTRTQISNSGVGFPHNEPVPNLQDHGLKRDEMVEYDDAKLSKLELDTQTIGDTVADSGYSSMGVVRESDKQNPCDDDNETVFTDKQDLDIANDIKEQLASAFSNEVFGHLQALIGNVDGKRSIKAQLSSLLKDFSIRLQRTARPGQQRDATVFVRHYRHRIANLLETSIQSCSYVGEVAHEDNIEEEEDLNPLKAEDGFTLDEKMELLLRTTSIAIKHGEDNVDFLDTEEEDNEEDYAISHFADAWEFVTGNVAYKWFVGKVKSAILLTDTKGTTMDHIGIEIARYLRSSRTVQGERHLYQGRFGVWDWPLVTFIEDHYPNVEHLQLGSIITINGSSVDAQAITCAEYMQQVWPATGLETLQVLQDALDKDVEKSHDCVTTDNTQIKVTISNKAVYATVIGTESAVAEIGQQLAWLGAALRVSPSSDKIACCTPKLVTSEDRNYFFTISFQVEDIEASELEAGVNGDCWRPLFRNPVIVQGYPILARLHNERGLEVPLNMMAGLGDASRVVNFDEGLLIKGFSTLFVPMKRIKDSVLWHYLFEEDGCRISYLAADAHCLNRARTSTVNASSLQVSRHFLGWTSSVEIRTGIKDIKYEDIEWPGSNLASAGIAFEKASIIVGNYITGGASFTRGNKDTPIYIRRGGPYEQEIHFASRIKVVLYDVGDRRGWLVDGASALLHLTRTQLASSPYSDSDLFKLEDFHHADPLDGICAAKRALLNPKNRELSIFEEIEISVESRTAKEDVRKTTKRWTYQDLVRQTYHIIEQMHDYETKMLTSPAIGVRLTDREKLMGFAFMDIVDGQNDLRPRVAVLKSSGKGWVDFTRSIRAVTLLGKGFGEIFKPSKDSNKLCKSWRHVPTGKDYLVACNSILKDICKRHGNHDSRPMELAQGIYWHNPDKLFESCDCNGVGSSICCDRVQVLLPPSLGTKRHPQPFRCPNGAVIFGRSKRFCWNWPNKGDPVEGEEADSGPDDSSGFYDSGLGDSDPSQLDSSNSDNAESSGPVSSGPPPCLDSPEITMSGTLKYHGDDPIHPNNDHMTSYEMQNFDLPAPCASRDEIMTTNDQPASLLTGNTSNQEARLISSAQTHEDSPSDPAMSLQYPREGHSRQRKIAWEKLKEITPQLFPQKRLREL